LITQSFKPRAYRQATFFNIQQLENQKNIEMTLSLCQSSSGGVANSILFCEQSVIDFDKELTEQVLSDIHWGNPQ
jgi:hypothetical protein